MRRAFAIPLLAMASVASAGCGRTNEYQGTQHLTIQPAAGCFTGYSQTNFGDSIDPTVSVHLLQVSLTSSSGEFSWASSVTGSAPATGTAAGPMLVSRTSFLDAQNPTDLDIDDSGDIRPLFPDEHTFRITWAFACAPTLTQAYPQGVTVTVAYTLELD
jgi:hypothetical protein